MCAITDTGQRLVMSRPANSAAEARFNDLADLFSDKLRARIGAVDAHRALAAFLDTLDPHTGWREMDRTELDAAARDYLGLLLPIVAPAEFAVRERVG